MSDEIAGWIKERMERMNITVKGLEKIQDRLNEAIKEYLSERPVYSGAYRFMDYTKKQKRKSWIEKIRDYDDVFSRMRAAESMREHYKAVAETALWNSASNGRRLKFSVGHNHIEIIAGNPVTACYFHSEAVDSDFDEDFLAVSILHKNDTYDWKRGAIESLENMIHNWIGSAYGDPAEYFNTLFTMYPELGIQPVVKPVKKTKKVKK